MKGTGIVKNLARVLAVTAVMAVSMSLKAAAPANDNVENAFELYDWVTAAEGNNTGATSQGYPEPVALTGASGNTVSSGSSIWYKWRASQSGVVSIQTGIPGAPTNQQSMVDTQLAVFRGTDPVVRAGLVLVAQNEDHAEFAGGSSGLSKVTFTATQGQMYYIMVDSYGGFNFTGVIKLYVNPGAYVPPQVNPAANALWWQYKPTGHIAFWNMNGDLSAIEGASLMNFNYPGWEIFATDDWNGDGTTDFFVQTAVGQVAYWTIDNTTKKTIGGGGWINQYAIPGWKAVALTDMNGDGTKDIVLSAVGAPLLYWTITKTNTAAPISGYAWMETPAVPAGWEVVGMGNFSGSGRKDVLWQNPAGQLAIWRQGATGGYSVADAAILNTPSVGTYWKVGSTRDLNADGKLDILWYGLGGEVAYWPMNNLTIITNQARILNVPKPVGWSLTSR